MERFTGAYNANDYKHTFCGSADAIVTKLMCVAPFVNPAAYAPGQGKGKGIKDNPANVIHPVQMIVLLEKESAGMHDVYQDNESQVQERDGSGS